MTPYDASYQDDGGPQAAGMRLPKHDQIIYTRDAIIVVLLIVSAPWVLHKLLTQPHRILEHAGLPK